MNRVTVSKQVLLWAVDRRGLTLEQLQKRFPAIDRWVTGLSGPTLRQLESLAKVTTTPLGYFFLKEPPVERLPIPHFRTMGEGARSTPSPDLLETVQTMQQRQDWMRDFLIDQEQEKISYVRSATRGQHPAFIAERMRITLGFEDNWASSQSTWEGALRALREAMDASGLIVVVNGIVGNNTHRKLDPKEFRGFVLVDDYAPVVFVNGADARAAQMFTLAHELAHVFFGSSAAFDLRELQPANNPMEQACNQVAAEFLIPEHLLRQAWPSVRSELEPFQSIARQFKVSSLVAARRALDLGLISKEAFFNFYDAYLSDERRVPAHQTGGGDFYATQNVRVGRRFASVVVRAAQEGKLLYSEAYRLTGLYGRTFDRYATYLGFEVRP